MKILQISYCDSGSEAAANALCLHRAFRQIGIGSMLLTAVKHTREAGVELLPGKWGRFWHKLRGRSLETRLSGLPEIVKMYQADAVLLHDISGGVAAPEELPALPGKIFWNLRSPEQIPDENDPLFQQKIDLWSKRPIQLIVPSADIAEKAAGSPVFCEMEQTCIPPGVDLSLFHPGNREAARGELGIRPGTFAVWSNPAGNPDIFPVIGSLKKKFTDKVQFIHTVPRNDRDMVRLCRACDLLLDGTSNLPLPGHILRAEACGLPVAAFESSGITEAVSDNWSGRLVPSGDRDAMSAAVEEIMENASFYRDGACEYAATMFADLSVARKYCDFIFPQK